MKKSELLRKAKRHVPKAKFICLALDFVVYHAWFGDIYIEHIPDEIWQEYKKTQDYIRMQQIQQDIWVALCGQHTIESWLEYVMKIDFKHASRNQMDDYRLRWMDKLIADYETKGE